MFLVIILDKLAPIFNVGNEEAGVRIYIANSVLSRWSRDISPDRRNDKNGLEVEDV
jgi:hypothetical protein